MSKLTISQSYYAVEPMPQHKGFSQFPKENRAEHVKAHKLKRRENIAKVKASFPNYWRNKFPLTDEGKARAKFYNDQITEATGVEMAIFEAADLGGVM